MPTRKIKYELADAGDAVVIRADDACWAAYDGIESTPSHFFKQKEGGASLTAGVVAQDVVGVERLCPVDYRTERRLSSSVMELV